MSKTPQDTSAHHLPFSCDASHYVRHTTHPPTLTHSHSLVVHRAYGDRFSSTYALPNSPYSMPFNNGIVNMIHAIVQFGVDAVLPPFVSPSSCRSSVHLPCLKTKINALRAAVPANGGAIIERDWVDERGNPSSFRVLMWFNNERRGRGAEDQA